jgi:hypothetical protein
MSAWIKVRNVSASRDGFNHPKYVYRQCTPLERQVTTLEHACVRVALESWAQRRSAGKLFINLSASAVTSALGGSRLQAAMAFLARCGVPVSALVIELTEHEQVNDIENLQGAMRRVPTYTAQVLALAAPGAVGGAFGVQLTPAAGGAANPAPSTGQSVLSTKFSVTAAGHIKSRSQIWPSRSPCDH